MPPPLHSPPHTPLGHWLRLLWGVAPALVLDSDCPYIARGEIHLPACSRWQQHRAAAAHAAAHLVYSPAAGFDGSGLGPIARALLALLEDARVEALARRELPGLARLWQPLHTATPDAGTSFEALMQRLARALADRDYHDPHPFVAKGRRLFYLDAGLGLGLLALRTPAELRQAATRLGHDIGQMRLPFNVKTYRPAPAYRDDHRWMWPAEVPEAAAPPAALSPTPASDRRERDAATRPATNAETTTLHPEWDGLIARLRPDWCRVIEQPAPAAAMAPGRAEDDTARLGHRLRARLWPLRHPVMPRGRHRDGDTLHLDALLHWCVARRSQRPGDPRVYIASRRRPGTATVWLLIDQSASTAAPFGIGVAQAEAASAPRTVLQAAAQCAAAVAVALQSPGVACAIAGFSSNGRHEVRLQTVKRLAEPAAEAQIASRLQALRSGGSTRLGAALRHATLDLAARRGGPHWVLLLSDGEPHDIDVHHRRYLVDDARHAVRAAGRHAVRMACIALSPESDADARRIFGRRHTRTLQDLEALPRVVQRLLS